MTITKAMSELNPSKELIHFAPCKAACPVNTDVQAYIRLIAQGRYIEAFEVIRSVNPFASACSMICHHPCEQSCRRSKIDEPIAIRHLKRFAVERSLNYRRSKRRLITKTKEKSIGIIGSGPSGLTAANDLAELGYNVTIYERHHILGGMLASAIPPYRLPREILQEDIDDIVSKGIDVKTNTEIGKDIYINDLMKKHDALLIAVGLSKSRSLTIPGVEGEGVFLAIPFLQDIAFGKKPPIGNNVLVIGGGNVAIDVARSAKRLGPKNVSMVCLESAEEMPAWKWEIDEAIEEGINILNRLGPKSVVRENGRVKGLEVVKVLSVFDKYGRFDPLFDHNQISFIEADTIIFAIGQTADLSFLNNSPIKTDDKGRIIWNPETHMSSVEGLFVAGEIVSGPGSAISAVASGHRAALAIHLYLQGERIEGNLPYQNYERIADMPKEVIEKIEKEPRIPIKHLRPEIRCSTFESFEITYNEREALLEAGRCRGCGSGAIVDKNKCMACLTCQRICPYGAPVVTSVSEIRPEYCQACGLCAPECPAEAISMIAYDVRELRNSLIYAKGLINPMRDEPFIVAFICTHHIGEDVFNVSENIHPLSVHCVSRIDLLDILKAFEIGADGVAIMHCSHSTCKYKGIEWRVNMRVKRAQELLDMLGIGKERLEMLSAKNGNSRTALCSNFSEKIKNLGLRKYIFKG